MSDKKRLVLLYGGYSVKYGIENDLWNKIKDIDIWAMNFCFLFMPYNPKRILWVDRKFFTTWCKELQKAYHRGVDLHCKYEDVYKLYNNPEDAKINTYKVLRSRLDIGHKDGIFIGRNGLVGIFSLSLAIKENIYDEIYLLGADHGSPEINEKNTHWYQDRIKEFNVESGGVGRPIVYLNQNNTVKPSVIDYDEFLNNKNRIINVSDKWNNRYRTNISQFDIIDYHEFFERIK